MTSTAGHPSQNLSSPSSPRIRSPGLACGLPSHLCVSLDRDSIRALKVGSVGDRKELIQTGLSIGGQGAVTPGIIRVWCPPHQAAASSNLEQVG